MSNEKEELTEDMRDCPWCGAYTRLKKIGEDWCCTSCDQPVSKVQAE